MNKFTMPVKFTLFISLLLSGCTNKQPDSGTNTDKRQYLPERNPVETKILQKDTFHNELVENGKLQALRKSTLNFGTGEKLVALYVKNGGYVQKGKPIACLRQDRLRQSLKLAKANLDKARLDLQDILIGQGYDINDSLHIPPDILEVAKVRSGYSLSALELSQAVTKLKSSELIAPFSGIVANIKHNVYEQVSAGEEFCTLIDNSTFEVSFSSLETEIQAIILGKEVKVIPFSMSGVSF
jgi:membrane fusion protein, multidrug efflux system